MPLHLIHISSSFSVTPLHQCSTQPIRRRPHLGDILAVGPAPSCPFRLAGVFRHLNLSKFTRWTRHRSPFARNLGTVSHFHGHCSQTNTVDTINGMELTEPDVPPYILRGRTEYTMLSFNRAIKHRKQSAVLPRPFEH
jgi:hypothetical protein